MTPIDGASRAQPPRSTAAQAQRADPTDVRAMRDAIEAARGKVDRPLGQPGKPAGQPDKKSATAHVGTGQARETAAAPQEQGASALRQKSRQESVEGLAGLAGQGAAIPPVVVVAHPSAPHVDAGAFAQMLADLWTRENGRGAKEVRVRFGDRAWPATGAVLVRNAAGTLDVALQVGDGGQAYGDALPGLEEALGNAGIAVGSLRIEGDA